MKQLFIVLLLAICAAVSHCQAEQGSFFTSQATGGVTYNGRDWWDVRKSDIPKMQSQAALFAVGIKSSPGAFAGLFTELVALVSPALFLHTCICISKFTGCLVSRLQASWHSQIEDV